MTPTLFEIRHSASHVLAQAVLAMFPDAKLGIGPAIDDGFYYDFDLPRTLTPDDLAELESKMASIIAEGQEFSTYTLDRSATETHLAHENQPYKLEIVNDLNLDTYSFYKNGPFVDLCRGPHVRTTADIGAIKLLRVSGAYWRGSEKNKMLQRIYGTAYHTQGELDAYLTRIEEAAKRDHRVLGKELDLFSIQDDIGPGLILWHPKGARVRSIIEDYWRNAHFRAGYDVLYTPHVGRSNLWETSGHLSFYSENMYAKMSVDDVDYYAKPMNCPFHVKIVQNRQYSYRDLPLRLAELGTVYRYERSGVLHGLMRVRGFTQDDAHIVCTPDQVESEIADVLTLCFSMLDRFGFNKVKVFLSTRPKEKYVGDLDRWATSETALKNAIESAGLPYEIDDGGGAFYGPKIDIKIEDAIGRQWQCSTVQFDFNLPERFDMTYVGPDGQRHRPYMIHRALLGSIERFFGILIEHYEGKFPTWLAPVQIKLLSVGQDVVPFSREIQRRLLEQDIRVVVDSSDEKIGYKIRQGLNERVPYLGVIGKREIEAGTISVRGRDGDLGPLNVEQVVDLIRKA
ncbi:threonine--tRNA ligase [bacterium]|nr:threonine--tRNA ligase [bacterium]